MKKIFARMCHSFQEEPPVTVWPVIGVCLPPPTNTDEPLILLIAHPSGRHRPGVLPLRPRPTQGNSLAGAPRPSQVLSPARRTAQITPIGAPQLMIAEDSEVAPIGGYL
jgi:hypothetical protein